jgi:glycosyltransferase involved in cell wall biosynthesis
MRIGIYQAYWGRVGGGQRYIAVAAQVLSKLHSVEIVHHCVDFEPNTIAEALEVDLSGVSFRLVAKPQRTDGSSLNPFAAYRRERELAADLSSPYEVFIDSSDNIPFFCHARKGVLLTHFPLVKFETFHGHQGSVWQNRFGLARRLRSIYHRLEWRRRFATYDLFLCNSSFTRKWLRDLWKVDAGVVYPPSRNSFAIAPKRHRILNIAAFDATQHKRHDLLIQSFKALCKAGLQNWELDLVGSAQTNEANAAYLKHLQTQAVGYPVHIRPNVPASQLRSLLTEAAIFWHAMGYGVDPEKDPSRLEHFGMVATEAMAAGCVPVVFDGGGLRESVEHGKNGFLWKTTEELAAQTLTLARDEPLRALMSAAGRVRAENFSEIRFEARLLEALTPVLS